MYFIDVQTPFTLEMRGSATFNFATTCPFPIIHGRDQSAKCAQEE